MVRVWQWEPNSICTAWGSFVRALHRTMTVWHGGQGSEKYQIGLGRKLISVSKSCGDPMIRANLPWISSQSAGPDVRT